MLAHDLWPVKLTAAPAPVGRFAPVLLFDPVGNGVGASHAGWRGTAAGVVRFTVQAMETEFRSRAADLIAAICPCLGRCCGEVGPDVRDLAGCHAEALWPPCATNTPA